MIAFLIICIAIVLWVQEWVLDNATDFVDANFWPEENVMDPDDVFNIIVELKNKKAFPVYFIKVRLAFPQVFNVAPGAKVTSVRSVNDYSEVFVTTWLKAGQTLKLKVPVSISARGRYFLPNPTIFFGDFLGLKEKRKDLSFFREVVVAPRSHNTDEAKQVLGKFMGEYSVHRFIYEDPVLTIGFREYTGREPMKMISWKQSARKQQLMVKEYDHTIEPVLSVMVNVETSGEKKGETIEKVFSIARSVCSNLEAKGVSYGFYINAQMVGGSGDMFSVNDGIGAHHFGKIMERLGRSIYTPALTYDALLANARKANGNERGLIVITPDVSAMGHTVSDGQILIMDASYF
ncbi:MAG: DUF58 domain-containing protein [Oscillospiraceae bacterium]|nr:DUF58 domain-containing protein [Oscillospiraceae bacterium]